MIAIDPSSMQKGFGLEQRKMGSKMYMSKEGIPPIEACLEVGEAAGKHVPK